MSRRVKFVQIAVGYCYDSDDHVYDDLVCAVDENGKAWRLSGSGSQQRWNLLPPHPEQIESEIDPPEVR